MLLLNMHGAKYSLARAINNLVSAGQNSKLYPYCLICFSPLDSPPPKVSQPKLKQQKVAK